MNEQASTPPCYSMPFHLRTGSRPARSHTHTRSSSWAGRRSAKVGFFHEFRSALFLRRYRVPTTPIPALTSIAGKGKASILLTLELYRPHSGGYVCHLERTRPTYDSECWRTVFACRWRRRRRKEKPRWAPGPTLSRDTATTCPFFPFYKPPSLVPVPSGIAFPPVAKPGWRAAVPKGVGWAAGFPNGLGFRAAGLRLPCLQSPINPAPVKKTL